MKRLIVLVVVFAALTANAQVGNIENLAWKNGFKTIRLGADLSTLKPGLLTYIQTSSDSVKMYEYRDTSLYNVSPDVKLSTVTVNAYQGKILNVTLLFNRDEGYPALLLFERAFGLYTRRPNCFINVYGWSSEKIDISLNFEGRVGYVNYTYSPLQDEIDKRKTLADQQAASKL